MKKLLLSLLFLAACCTTSFAQTAAADSTLNFTSTVADAAYVCGIMQNTFDKIDVAIAPVIAGKTDTSEVVTVTLKQRDIVTIARTLRNIAEGDAAAVNARMKAAIIPMLSTRPWLAEQMTALFAANEEHFRIGVAEGLRIANRIAAAWNSN